MTKHPASHHPVHHFGEPRPSVATPHSQLAPMFKGSPFQPLPPPTGAAPFRIDLAALVPDAAAAAVQSGGLVLHMVGDTGGIQDPTPQMLVAAGLEQDAAVGGPHGTPCLFYHLGDVVYFDGAASEYYPQFYSPYEHYPNPIIGIPGNHDGDIYDNGKLVDPEPSLAPFMRNLCAATPGIHTADARDISRTAMIQPNCYFTLNTPVATLIGLYTNVPEGGVVQPDQQQWLADEMRAADPSLPLIVCLHHPIHSLDRFHSGSAAMATVLNTAIASAGRKPDLVFSAHVHNYQRFTITDMDGAITPYIVAGFGGYHTLHAMAKVANQPIVTPYRPTDQIGVQLDSYVDDRFGFLRLEITRTDIIVSCYTVPRPQESWSKTPRLFDQLHYNWQTRTIVV